MKQIVRCARALVDGREQRDFAFIVEAGNIVEIGATNALHAREVYDATLEFGPEVIVCPGLINGHSHAYQILLRGWADDLSFDRWRKDALYKVVPSLTPDDVYWTFVAAFSEMLAAGITTVVEFFYLNGRGNDHAEAAIRAAHDTGIRLVLARTWMDAASAPEAFRETIDQAATRTRELIDAHPALEICVAPHSLHAASPEMIRAASEFAERHDVLLHIHVAEAAYEGKQCQALYGATPVQLLDRWQVLNERVVAIHAIFLSEEEKRLLVDRGTRVVHNPTTNQYLGDGICDVAGLQRLGVPIALGTDADVKPSLIDEMRAAALLQKIARRDGSALDAAAVFDFATRQGASALRLNAGSLAPGKLADYIVIDGSRIDPWSPVLNAIVYRGESAWIKQAYVHGKRVYDGQPSASWQTAKAALGKRSASLHLGGAI